MERRQIFDIKKYESIQYLGNVIKDTMPFMLNTAVTYKFDNNIDDINEQIQRSLYYRSECSLVLDQRFLIRSNNGITLSPTYGLTDNSYNIAFMFHENRLSSCRWLIVLYGHQIYIGFNMFTHDAFRGNTEVMVNLLEELNMNCSDITCSYGMPTGYECRGYSGFYQIKGINNLPLKYTFMERLIRYFVKYYKDEDELIEKRKSDEIKIRNKYDKGFGYYKIINVMESYGCIDDFIDSLNYRRTCVKYFNNRKYVFISPVRNIVRCDFDGYMIDIKVMKYNFGIFESIRNEIHDYIYKLPYMISDLSVYDEILDKVHRWNYIILSFFGNKITKPIFKMRELFKRLKANRYDKINSGFEFDQSYNDAVIIAYIKSRFMLLYDMMISDNKNNRTFIPDYAMRIFERNQTVENILNEHNTVVGKKLAEITDREERERISKQKARIVTCSREYLEYLQYIKFQREYNSYHFQYPEDDELKWHLKNALNEDFTNIEDNPEWKFYNMNMKDLMDGNF